MNVQFGETKAFIRDVPEPEKGSYTLDSPLNWRKCREQFSGDYKDYHSGFFYSHSIGGRLNIPEFIYITEEILGAAIPFEEKSKFAPSNRPYATWIEPAKFWSECWIRRSLLTILLRCGEDFRPEKENYEEALFGNIFISSTKLAMQRFLFGYTIFVEDVPIIKTNKVGWHSVFLNKDATEVRKMLTKPDNFIFENTTVGIGSIWN